MLGWSCRWSRVGSCRSSARRCPQPVGELAALRTRLAADDAAAHAREQRVLDRRSRRRPSLTGSRRVAPTLAASMTPRHFLTGAELSAAELDALLDRALELKRAPLSSRALAGRSVALIFEKPSTRTRVSFEVGIHELGGHAVVLRSDELQLSRGEAPRDTALVLSRHVAAVGLRTGADAILEELAAYSTRADRQHAQRPPPPLPGARRPAHAARGVRRARGRCAWRTSATATTSRARSPCWARSRACTWRSPRPPGYSLEDDLALPAGADGYAHAPHRPARGGAGRARGLHRRVGEHGR